MKWQIITKAKRLGLLSILIYYLQSCNHKIGDYMPVQARGSDLIEFTWGLTSATSILSQSTGALHNYKGLPGDSLHFLWSLNSNVNIYGIESFVTGTNPETDIHISALLTVSAYDTSTLAYDTVFCSSPWKTNYSDTLFISKTSPTILVFKVAYSDVGGTGIEVDSFRKIGLYTPF
jgi:hypothetical protein